MQITKLEQGTKNKNRFNMYVDKKFRCSVSLDTIIKFHLYEKTKISDEQIKQINIEELYLYLLQRIFKFISTRNRSVKEIDEYLNKYITREKRINLSKKDVQSIKTKILKKLEEYELFDDHKFSENLIKSKIARWKYSKREIESKLIQYGVRKDVYERILDNLYTEKIEQETIQKLIKKKNRQDTTKLINYLLHKGFNYRNIKKLIYILK